MLAVRDVTVRYAAMTAVDRATLEVPDGEVLALLGPSGCGKSTLLRAIAGLEATSAGSVQWDGVDLGRIPVHRRGFGLMFQEGVLFPHRTVGGNVGYGLRGQDDASGRVSELLEMVGLAGYADRRVATLSGGEAQRVALARALAPEPRLLLLDEPLAALDRSLRDQLLADLGSVLRHTGTTAIFVTHDQDEAFAIADRIAVMRAGRIVQSGAPHEVWSNPADDWVARFLGCTTVVGSGLGTDTDTGASNGKWQNAQPAERAEERLGERPGQAEAWNSVIPGLAALTERAGRVGLRPMAFVVDASSDIAGEIISVVPGIERQEVTVRLVYDGVRAELEVTAVADPGRPLAAGDSVRLRFDSLGAVPIGSGHGAPHPREQVLPDRCP